jgi:hypothetical protein
MLRQTQREIEREREKKCLYAPNDQSESQRGNESIMEEKT